jgi:phosphoglycerate dehydrogenase-like enzyme
MKTLLLTHPMPAAPFAEAIRSIEPQLPLIEYHPRMDMAALADVQAVLGWRFPDGLAARLPQLRWVCSVGAGVDKLLAPDLPPQVPVSRIVDAAQAAGIAQFVVLMALRHARDLPHYEALQRRREWSRRPTGAVRPRVGLLGMGAMGSAIAQMLRAVGFEVTGYSRRASATLQAVLGASDIVVCALPLTRQTAGVLDARALALMPRGGYLINIARGAHVVEADLIDAVRSGHLSGAALDVQAHEPMAADDPLWELPGITLTPHIAAQFVQGWRCVQRGEPAPNRVDRALGY